MYVNDRGKNVQFKKAEMIPALQDIKAVLSLLFVLIPPEDLGLDYDSVGVSASINHREIKSLPEDVHIKVPHTVAHLEGA